MKEILIMIEVRIAKVSDAQAILDIYTPYIHYTAYTFETEMPSVAQFQKRIETNLLKFPWIVCKVNDLIAGYAYASTHREREAYQWSCESSVYVHELFKGKGIGRILYQILFDLLMIQGLRNVYAGITLPNEVSVRIHEKCGFEQFAVYNNVGYKLNSWHKVGWWRLHLNDYDLNPAPPIMFSNLDYGRFSEKLREATQMIKRNIRD